MKRREPEVEFDDYEPEPITEEHWEACRRQFYFAAWGYTAWLALILLFLLSGEPK